MERQKCLLVSNIVLHQIEDLKAVLSNREYQIITECALSNMSETPHLLPPLELDSGAFSADAVEPVVSQDNIGELEAQNGKVWISMKVSVLINLVELSLHVGVARDASLATIQVMLQLFIFKFLI